jgi:hypothetical protein
MNTKILLIGGIAAATVLTGGWVSAQTQGHDHGATVGQHAQANGPHGMGPQGMGHGRMQHQGQGHQGQGHGQMHGRMQQMMQQKMQHMGGKRQHMTQGQGTTQPGTTQPQTAQPGGNTGSAHQH